MSLRTKIAILGLAAALLGIGAGPAFAVPAFEVGLTNDAGEVQEVTVDATGGQYRLAFGSGGPGISETGDIAVAATAAQVQAALNGLTNVSTGGGFVTVIGGPGGATGATPYLVSFYGGPLATVDVPQLQVLPGTAPLSGGAALAGVSTFQHGGVHRVDERLDYAIELKNLSAVPGGAASVGDALLCQKGIWQGEPGTPPQLSVRWLRGGQLIPGETGELHIATAEDAGKPIQCLVRGDNNVAASVQASQPPSVVNPQPATAPPAPSSPVVAQARPTITDSGGASVENAAFTVKRFCHEPTNWTGSPSWTYRWLLNAEQIAGATTAEYQPVASDEGKILQCEATATNAGGTALATSSNNQIGTVAGAPRNTPGNTPKTIANATTVTLALPGGAGTHPYKYLSQTSLAQPGEVAATNWACREEPAAGAVPAKAVCASFQTVAPGSSYERLVVATALGADAPTHAVATVTVSGGGTPEPAVASDVFDFLPALPFGTVSFEAVVSSAPAAASFSAGEPAYTQAGGHPLTATGRFEAAHKRQLARAASGFRTKRFTPLEHVRSVVVDTPRGFVGNALAVERTCASVAEVAAVPPLCPPASAVGGVLGRLADTPFADAIFSIEPEFGTPAQFAFSDAPLGNVYVFAPKLRANDGYAISLVAAPAPSADLLSVTPTLCGFGLKKQLLFATVIAAGKGSNICYAPGDPGASSIPLITNPTRCDGPPPRARVLLASAEHPGAFDVDGYPDLGDPAWASATFDNPPITGCEQVKFEPRMELAPTSRRADSPTGLDVELSMPTEGLERASDCHEKQGDTSSPVIAGECISQANLRAARVTFPPGMVINPSAGTGLAGCAADQVRLGTNQPISCPEASKIGTVEIDTPLISETLHGAMYVGKQADAPAGALIGLYLVFSSPRDGILIKLPAKVVTSEDGQLTVVVDESPEDPFSQVRMHFAQGPRASLIAPPRCGTYRIEAELIPWSGGDPVTDFSTLEVNEGPDGTPCPSGALAPSMQAGTVDRAAAQPSPFVLRLRRGDGSDRFRSLSVETPPGLTAFLRGVQYCPDSVLAAIPAGFGTGQGQIENPTCPAASRIGTAVAGAGAGPDPFFADTGKVYLAGPYKGAPLSIAVVAPAVAGPLDLGNVVVRNAIHVDPETAQITAVSDPIPTIWHGLPLDLREIRIAIDRPHFTRNPSSCRELRVSARVTGASGAVANLANRFQASDCAKLPFEPKLSVRLFGGTHRGAHPRLRGVISAGDDEASIAHAAVTIPRSEFLDQAHIRTICTRVQFAADACPKAAIYGHAKAWTPLLDYPVEGPVYLRSSDHYLPDLVVDLKGPDYQPIEAVVVGRVDSIKGQIRTTFESTPDVPVSKFVLEMEGGQKGLLVNSRDICARGYRATVKLGGHNGAEHDTSPILRNSRCGAKR